MAKIESMDMGIEKIKFEKKGKSIPVTDNEVKFWGILSAILIGIVIVYVGIWGVEILQYLMK